MNVYTLTWLVLLAPTLGCLASFLTESARRVGQVCLVFCVIALVLAVAVAAYRLGHRGPTPYQSAVSLWTMQPSESAILPSSFAPELGFRIDGLSVTFMAAIALVGCAVQWSAMSSLRRDPSYRRFFRVACLLTSGLLALVAAPSTVDLLVAWGVVGAASFLLAAQWWQRREPAEGVTRSHLHLMAGDLALLLAVVLGFAKFGRHAATQPSPPGSDTSDPFSFLVLGGSSPGGPPPGEWRLAHLGSVPGVGPRTLAVLALLFVVAALVRSAHLPFHAWLAELSEVPAASLALVAAGTPAAGIILLARVYPLLLEVPHAPTAIAVVGAVTALVASLIAAAQRDAVRLVIHLAVAQLGLVAAALGMGGFGRSLFALLIYTLLTPALILTVGAAVRAFETRDLGEMGEGLRRTPTTAALLLACSLGLAGASLAVYSEVAAALAGSLPNGGHIAAVPRALVTAAVLASALLVATVALRLALRFGWGALRRRRGFDPRRLRDPGRPQVGGAATLVVGAAAAVAAGIPGVRYTFTRFVYLGDRPPTLHAEPAAVALSLGIAVVAAAVAWLPLQPRAAGVLAVAARGRVASRAVRAAAAGFGITTAMASWPAAAAGAGSRLLSRQEHEILEPVTEGGGEALVAAAEAVKVTRTRRLGATAAVSLASATVVTAVTVLAATGHLPGLP